MVNVLMKLAVLLLTIGIVIYSEAADSSGAAVVSISLLVELDGRCKSSDIEGISDDVRGRVNSDCIVISSSLECCSEHYAVYKLNLSSCRSATADKLIVNSSVHSTSHDHVVKLRQCYYGNCTCDSSTASSDNQRIILILAIICGSLFILVLLILLIICYKCYQLHHQRKTVKMIPAPIPSPRPPLQHRQSAVGSSEYIAAADIASPTFPPTFHHSNNHCHMHMANGSFDLIQQSTLVEYNVDCTANNITSQQQALHDDNLEHSVTGKSSHQQSSPPLHGTIITPNGLVAVIKVPTLDVIEADNMISSQMYPGYVEHKINDTHL